MAKSRLRFLAALISCALALAGSATAQVSDLDRVAAIVEKIKLEYVDPVDDAKLIEGCREGLGRSIDRYSNSPTPSEAQSSNPKSASLEISGLVRSAKQQAPEGASERKLVDACLRGMLKGLDRESNYLDEDLFKEQFQGPRGNVAVGLTLKIEADLPKIVAPIDGGPADLAGLKPGDVILKIDSASTSGISLEEILRRLRGPVGSITSLTIMREGRQQPLEFRLAKAVVKTEGATGKIVLPGYLYLRVQFRDDTVAAVARVIEDSYRQNQGDLKGLILDLRDNGGGLLSACAGVSAAFLPTRALVFYTKGRTKQSTFRVDAVPGSYVRGDSPDPLKNLPIEIKSVPMVVLVNHQTAGCSEIVAGALQDHKRAAILGARTRGQGTVATIYPMQDKTAVKITTARFYRPSGKAIADVGVTPDMVIETDKLTSVTFDTARDPVIFQAMEQLSGRSGSDRPGRAPAGDDTVAVTAAPPESTVRRKIVPISGADPIFPRAAIAAGIEKGRVVCHMRIDETGNVYEVTIVQADPPGHFDQAVIEALSQWKFLGDGTKYKGEVEIKFELKDGPARSPDGLTSTIAALVKKYEAAQPGAPVPDVERAALAREIIDVSGTREKIALAMSPESFREGIDTKATDSKLSPKLREAFGIAFLASFRADRVLQSLERGLSEKLDSATLRAGLEWERSEPGRTINRLELEAEAPELRTAKKEFEEQFIKKGGAANDPRARACAQKDILDNSAEAALPIVEAIFAGVGMAAIVQRGQPLDLDAIQRFVVGVRPILRDTARQTVLAGCLFSFQGLGDAEFDKWIEFLRTDLGGGYARGVSTASRNALLEAAEVFTRTMVDIARQLKVSGES